MPPRLKPAMHRANEPMTAWASRVPPFAVIHHAGRRSGRAYRTPVVAFASRGGADGVPAAGSPLPWGADVDWCRNILAAGSYELTRRGRRYRVDEAHLVDADEARRLFGTAAWLTGLTFRPKQWVVGRLSPAVPQL